MNPEQLQLFGTIEDQHWWFAARRIILNRILSRLYGRGADSHPRMTQANHGPSYSVIDIGCGTGGNIGSLPAGFTCIGVDASDTAITLARRRFPHVQFVHGMAPQAVERPLRTADMVLMMDVIEHVQDDLRMVSENFALMKPGSHLLITVPADPAMWTVHDEAVLHWRRYTVERLRAVWRGLPVHERLVSFFNTRLWPAAWASRMMSRRTGRAAGSEGTDLKMPSAVVNRTLTRIFAGEGHVLSDAIDRDAVMPYARGVSLIAVLQRRPGACSVRSRTALHGRDQYDPERGVRL